MNTYVRPLRWGHHQFWIHRLAGPMPWENAKASSRSHGQRALLLTPGHIVWRNDLWCVISLVSYSSEESALNFVSWSDLQSRGRLLQSGHKPASTPLFLTLPQKAFDVFLPKALPNTEGCVTCYQGVIFHLFQPLKVSEHIWIWEGSNEWFT